MTIRGDREYFAEHPQYHMAAGAEWPSYEEQIAARDRMLDRHPKLAFVGVHLASLEWDVDRIAGFLRRYPNANVDLAARLSHLQLQASRDHDKVRRFFIEFQDRILYGSDFARGDGQSDARVRRRDARGLARRLAVPRWRRRAALGRVRRAVSRAWRAARGDRQGVPRQRAPSLPCCAWQCGAVQGDGIRLEFDGAMKSRVVATIGHGNGARPVHGIGNPADRLPARFGGFTLQSQNATASRMRSAKVAARSSRDVQAHS